MTCLKHRKEQTNSLNCVMQKSSNLEELKKLLREQMESSQGPRMIILDLWLNLNLFNEISMVNSPTKLICNVKLKMRITKIEISKVNYTKENKDKDRLKIK